MAFVTACDGDAAEWRDRWHSTVAELDREKVSHTPEKDEGPAPYVGLAAFQTSDADLFFGRERVVDDLAERIRDRRFIGVFGASGSGKSSVLRAGLIARAQTRGLFGAGPQQTVLFTPGARPSEECAVHLAALIGESATALREEFDADPTNLHVRIRQALADQPVGADLLLVVDQFEELFTLCQDQVERAQFVQALIHAATAENSRTRVVLGVRADFYGRCGEHPELVEALRDAQVLVGPMSADELRRAITQPAGRTGCIVEGALVTRLVADAVGQAGVLPLLSHALLETWRRRRGTTLTLAGYEAAGGMWQAVAHSAEDVYNDLDHARQRVARQIFLRLTALGESTEDTKRRVHRRELDGDTDTKVVLEKLAAARLITVDQDSVEIAHEVLIRCWPRLHDWLTQDRDGLRIHRQLTEATDVWHLLDHDPGALYRGTRLALAQGWAATNGTELSTREQRFLTASLSAQASEHTRTLRRARRLRLTVALLSVLLLLGTTATILAIRAEGNASRQRDIAIARKVIRDADALRASNPALSLQLSLAAYRLAPEPEVRDNLLNTLDRPYASRLTGHTAAVTSARFSPDGQILATTSRDRSVRLSDVTDPRRPQHLTALPLGGGSYRSAMFSAGGRTLVTTDGDHPARLWDVTDPRRPAELGTVGPSDGVRAASVPNGHLLATASRQRTVQLWDIADPRQPHELATLDTNGILAAIAFSPDGRTLAVGGVGPVQLWDVTDPRRPQPMATLNGVGGFAFSPGGRVLAVLDSDGTNRLWDISAPHNPRLAATFVVKDPASQTFSPDSHVLAVGSGTGTARLFDVTRLDQPRELTTLDGHVGEVSVAFSPDGHTLATAGVDKVTRLHDVGAASFRGRAGLLNDMVFGPDGRTLATAATGEGNAQLWDVANPSRPSQLTTFPEHADDVFAVAFSPDGNTLVTGGRDRVMRLWDVTDPGRPRELSTSQDRDDIYMTVFSPDGHTLVTTGGDHTVRLWDVTDPRNPRKTATLDNSPGVVLSAAFSSDGRTLATKADKVISLWEISDLSHPVKSATLPGVFHGMAFAPKDHTLATAHADNTARLWDVTDARNPRELAVLTGHTDPLHAVDFSPDGHTLATAGEDKTTRLWDVTDRHRPRQKAILTGHTQIVAPVVFSPDGHTLATTGFDNTVRLWETDADRVAGRICDTAWPRITQDEWNDYLPGLSYQPPCP